MGQLCCIGERSLLCPRNWCWIKNLAESDDWILTRGKVTWRISPLLQMSFSRFAAMATMSRPSTSPAPTSSVAMPSAVSFPSMNSNLMSFSSRREFLSTESSYLQTLTRVKTENTSTSNAQEWPSTSAHREEMGVSFDGCSNAAFFSCFISKKLQQKVLRLKVIFYLAWEGLNRVNLFSWRGFDSHHNCRHYRSL